MDFKVSLIDLTDNYVDHNVRLPFASYTVREMMGTGRAFLIGPGPYPSDDLKKVVIELAKTAHNLEMMDN